MDQSGQAMRFLKYQLGSFFRSDDVIEFTKQKLNRALAGAVRHGYIHMSHEYHIYIIVSITGKTLTLHFPTLECVGMEIFEPTMFPKEIVSRNQFYQDSTWQSIFKPELGKLVMKRYIILLVHIVILN